MFLTSDTEEAGHGVTGGSACAPDVRVVGTGSRITVRPRRHLDVRLLPGLPCRGSSAAVAVADVSAAAVADAAVAALKHVFVIQSFSIRERRPAKHGGWRVRSMGGSWVCAASAVND